MRASRAIGVVALAAGVLLAGTGAVPASAQAADTEISVLAGVPGEAVDVVVDDEPLAGSLAYGEVSEPIAVDPGRHEVLVGPRGGADEEPERLEVQVDEGASVTVARFLDRTGAPQVDTFPEDRSPVPADRARLLVRHLAELPEADVRLAGRPIATGVASGRTATSIVEPGAARLDVVLAGADDELLPPADIDLRAGEVAVVSVVGSSRDDDLDVVVQRFDVEETAAEPQQVTVVQGLLGTEVDVWIDGQRQVSGLDATRLAAGLELPAGRHQFAFRLTGDEPDSPPLAVQDVEVEGGPLAVVVHLDADGAPAVSTFADPDPAAVGSGSAGLTVRHVGVGGPVDVDLGGREVAGGLEPGAERSAVVAAGTGIVDVTYVEGGARLAPVDVQLGEGTSTVLYVVGSPEDRSATVLVEAAGGAAPAARTVPTGTPPATGAATPFLWLAAVLGLAAPWLTGRIRAVAAR